MRRIELPTNELAAELKDHLEEKRFTITSYDKGRRALQFPDDMNPSQWSSLRSTVEKWAKGKRLDVVESLRLQPQSAKSEPASEVNHEKLGIEVKKKLDSLSSEEAEERYDYLSSRPLTELTDAEFEERLALAQRTFEDKKKKNDKR